MKTQRRKFLRLLAGAAALPAMTRRAFALDYPTRPVRILVGYPAGIAPDIFTRIAAQGLSERLGQNFIVDKLNKAINAGFADQRFKARLADLGGDGMPGTPTDFTKVIADETEKWGKVVKFAGLKAE